MTKDYLVGIEPTLESIHKHLTLHEVDCSFFGPSIHEAIKATAKMNGVTQETVLWIMLPILGTACGMNTYINAGTHPFETKPNIYAINLLNSGGSKSTITSMLLKNTLKPLDKQLRARNLQQQDSVEIDKDGPIVNSTEKQNEITRIRLGEHNAIISKATPESMFHYAGNGAMLLFYDELFTFVSNFLGTNHAITDLTELYQTHSIKKVLIGRGSASIDDSSVSVYAHGTPTLGMNLISEKMRSDGSSWRFWINIDTPEPTTLSFEEFLASNRTTPPNFTEFDNLFKLIARSHFERTDVWSYSYTREALEAKSQIWEKLRWVANSLDNSLMSTMLFKLPAIIDKCALIHSIARQNLDPYQIPGSPSLNRVDQGSLDFGWDMARKVWTGWMSMIQLDVPAVDEKELKQHSVTKPTQATIIYDKLVTILEERGGDFTLPAWQIAIEEFPFPNRSAKKRFLKFLSSDTTLLKQSKK